MLSIGKENKLFINFHVLLDKHWHFQVAVRVTAGKYLQERRRSRIYILEEFHSHQLSCCFVLGQVEKYE